MSGGPGGAWGRSRASIGAPSAATGEAGSQAEALAWAEEAGEAAAAEAAAAEAATERAGAAWGSNSLQGDQQTVSDRTCAGQAIATEGAAPLSACGSAAGRPSASHPHRHAHKQITPDPMADGDCAAVAYASDPFRPVANSGLHVQPAEHAVAGPLVQRVSEAPIRGVEDDGPARAQMTPPVRVGTDEDVHQAAVDPANLRRQTPRIGVSGSPWVRRLSWSAGQPVSELLSAGWWWW
jgi:hypothetical protein